MSMFSMVDILHGGWHPALVMMLFSTQWEKLYCGFGSHGLCGLFSFSFLMTLCHGLLYYFDAFKNYLFPSFLPLNKYNDVLLFYLLGELFLELNRDYQTAASTLYQWTVSSKIGFDSMVFGMRSHERSFQYQIPKFGWDQIQNIQAWLWRNNLKWLQCLEWNKLFVLYTE